MAYKHMSRELTGVSQAHEEALQLPEAKTAMMANQLQ
jgi:hypothetical protein